MDCLNYGDRCGSCIPVLIILRLRQLKLWISTESGSYYLDLTSFASGPMNTLRSMTYSGFPMPDMLNVVDMAAKRYYTSMTMSRVMMTEDYVFGASLYSDENYGNPSNRMDVMK